MDDLVTMTQFSGTAEVLGAAKEVTYGEGALTIRGLAPQDLRAVLTRLRGTAGVQAPKPTPPKAPAAPPAPTPAPKQETQAAPPAAKPEPAAAPPKTNGHANGNGSNGAGDPWGLTPPEPAPAAPEPEAPRAAPPADGAVPSELLSARKLRDVLAYFIEQGTTDEDGLVSECERMKGQVPVLGRIANLNERVKRTLEVMDRGVD